MPHPIDAIDSRRGLVAVLRHIPGGHCLTSGLELYVCDRFQGIILGITKEVGDSPRVGPKFTQEQQSTDQALLPRRPACALHADRHPRAAGFRSAAGFARNRNDVDNVLHRAVACLRTMIEHENRMSTFPFWTKNKRLSAYLRESK